MVRRINMKWQGQGMCWVGVYSAVDFFNLKKKTFLFFIIVIIFSFFKIMMVEFEAWCMSSVLLIIL